MALLTRCVLVVCLTLAASECPHEEKGLIPWSKGSSWPTGEVPAENSTVVIKSGTKIVLDNSTLCLASITIEKGAVLVWGDVDDLTMCADYIYIEGRFQIGSEECRFTKKAHIKLTGESNSPNFLDGFGRKFLGVGPGGVLELHGAEKPAWTQLIRTAPAFNDTCGVVYDFQKSQFANETEKNGLYTMVFNTDGTVFDFKPFYVPIKVKDYRSFLLGIPNGKVVAVSLHKTVKRASKSDISTALEELGGLASSAFRSMQDTDAYAFITQKGYSYSTVEKLVERSSRVVTTGYLTLDSMGLQFAVKSIGGPALRRVDFRVLTEGVAYPRLLLNADVTAWYPGDKVVVASTDYDWKQSEVKTIKRCPSCLKNEIALTEPFEFMHYGEITYGVDERAEVALLSRNILIEGTVGDDCIIHDDGDKEMCDIFGFDTFGGHVKIVRGFGAAHVQGVELYHMGQQKNVGTYPLHFHMCDDVSGNWLRYNSIHDSFTRCVTIHGTDSSEVSHNVCYKHRGHGFFLEDSVEQYNVLDGNFCLGTMHGTHLLTDRKKEWCGATYQKNCGALASYWITHPNNIFRNNVAAGGDGSGFWYIASKTPLTLSRERQKILQKVGPYHAVHSPVLEFKNNKAHSQNVRGLRMDGSISDGTIKLNGIVVKENGIRKTGFSHVPQDSNGKLLVSNMTGFTAYKNGESNVWGHTGIVHMYNFTSADSPDGILTKTVLGESYLLVENALVVGETENIGLPQAPYGRSVSPRLKPNAAIQGVAFYKGLMFVHNSHFRNFTMKVFGDIVRNAGAFGGKRDNKYRFRPFSHVQGLTFDYCDRSEGYYAFNGYNIDPYFHDGDGNKQLSFYDMDGSVTGTPDTHVVPINPFFLSDRCSLRTHWNFAVCPHGYAKAMYIGDGDLGTRAGTYPIRMRRDDRPDDDFAISGERGNHFLVIKNISYTVYFTNYTPRKLEISANNLEKGEHLRFGVCFPKDVQRLRVHVIGKTKVKATRVASLQEVKDDKTGTVYHWDQTRGILSVKTVSHYNRLTSEPCPGDVCPTIEIRRDGGSDEPADCFRDAYDGTYNTTVTFSRAVPDPQKCVKSSSKGYGAPVEPNHFATDAHPLSCSTTSSSEDWSDSLYVGCFLDSTSQPDLPDHNIYLAYSMNVEFCIERCHQKGYSYAGLTQGSRCQCGNSYGSHGNATNCDQTCTGKPHQICGGTDANSVYTTAH